MRRWIVVLVAVVVGWAASTSAASAAVWTGTTPQPFYPDLVGVGASSATDVWAVGENDADFSSPVAEHWSGTAWQASDAGGLIPDGRDGGLLGVSALSTGDAWAVGWQDVPGAGGVLAAFWDGSSWSAVPTPAAVGGGRRELDAVSMLSRDDVWAVGGQPSGALMEHWNGTRWGVVTSHGTVPLTSVQAVSASNVWAVGGDVVEHYNGTKWATVPAPVTSTTTLSQVTRIPGTAHLWAVGTNTATGKPIAIYYNGTSWRAHNPPGAGALDGVAALSAGDLWASGTTLTGDSANVTFHWTGSAWHPVAAAGLANGWVENMTRAPGSTELWAVGMNLTTDGPFAAYRP
jgi:hypothetical protein